MARYNGIDGVWKMMEAFMLLTYGAHTFDHFFHRD